MDDDASTAASSVSSAPSPKRSRAQLKGLFKKANTKLNLIRALNVSGHWRGLADECYLVPGWRITPQTTVLTARRRRNEGAPATFTVSEVKLYCAVMRCNALTQLNIVSLPIDDEMLPLLTRSLRKTVCPTLKDLVMSGANRSAEDRRSRLASPRRPARLASPARLLACSPAHLLLTGNKLGPSGCSALFFAMGTETAHPNKRILLERLTVTNNEAGKAGAEAIRHVLAGQTNLTRLDLAGNTLGDPGGSAIAACLAEASTPAMAPLSFVGLRSNFIGLEGFSALLEALEGHTYAPQLQSVDMGGNVRSRVEHSEVVTQLAALHTQRFNAPTYQHTVQSAPTASPPQPVPAGASKLAVERALKARRRSLVAASTAAAAAEVTAAAGTAGNKAKAGKRGWAGLGTGEMATPGSQQVGSSRSTIPTGRSSMVSGLRPASEPAAGTAAAATAAATASSTTGGAAGGATKGGLGAALAASRFLRLRKRKEKYFGEEEGVEASGGGSGGGGGADGGGGRGKDEEKDEEKGGTDESGKSIWDREYGEPLVCFK